MQLYHPLILKYARVPVGFEKRPSADFVKEAYNPLCGDKFVLYLDIRECFIEKISFHGYGCAVSKAAAVVLVQQLSGKSLHEAARICTAYLKMLESGVLTNDENLNIFEAARHHAGRQTCASLVWAAFQQVLNEN